jgi:hypothetical protein
MREGGECRDSVPFAAAAGDSNDPGLSLDLPVYQCLEGPDMPKNDEDKQTNGTETPRGDADDLRIRAPTDLVVYQCDVGGVRVRCIEGNPCSVNNDTSETEDASKIDSDYIGVVLSGEEECATSQIEADRLALSLADAVVTPTSGEVTLATEGEKPQSPASSREEVSTNSNSEETRYDFSSGGEPEKVVEQDSDHFASIEQTNDERAENKDSTDNCNELDEKEISVDSANCMSSPIDSCTSISLIAKKSFQLEEVRKDTTLCESDEHQSFIENESDVDASIKKIDSLETSSDSEQADLATKNDEHEIFAPELFVPMLDHVGDGTQYEYRGISSSVDTDSRDESKFIDRLKSNGTDKTLTDSFDESDKSVRFADPLVTSSWDVPRIHSDDIEELFYTAMDISK